MLVEAWQQGEGRRGGQRAELFLLPALLPLRLLPPSRLAAPAQQSRALL